MSLYSDYLDAKSDLLSKDLAFKTAVSKWFDERDLQLLQPIDMIDTLTMDHFTITSTEKFEPYLYDFSKTFGVECVRINHQEIIVPGETVKHVWKFHFKEEGGIK